MILITDIGKDPDDAIALVYAILAGVPITDVVVTTKETVKSCNIVHHILEGLADRYPQARYIQVFAGSTAPVKKHAKPFHTNIYQGSFCDTGPIPEKFEPLKIEDPDDVVAIGPLTDLMHLLERDRVKRVIFMGQPKKDHDLLAADLDSYNFRCDPFASEAVFQFQDRVPYAFIGKQLAYKVPLTTQDIDRIAAVKHPVAEFLVDHVYQSFEEFKKRMPEVWESKYKGTDNLSYCYDPLTMLAVKEPGLFTFEKFGLHRIGANIEAKRAKGILLGALSRGLS